MPPDPAAIARSLSPAQRKFVTKRWGMCSVSGEEWDGLVRLGITTPNMHATRLTPLGQAVRKIVAEEARDGG